MALRRTVLGHNKKAAAINCTSSRKKSINTNIHTTNIHVRVCMVLVHLLWRISINILHTKLPPFKYLHAFTFSGSTGMLVCLYTHAQKYIHIVKCMKIFLACSTWIHWSRWPLVYCFYCVYSILRHLCITYSRTRTTTHTHTAGYAKTTRLFLEFVLRLKEVAFVLLLFCCCFYFNLCYVLLCLSICKMLFLLLRYCMLL